MKKLPNSLISSIQKRKDQDAFRELLRDEGKVDFYSNDYLGLSKWRDEIQASSGSTGSRLISGNSARTEEIEKSLAHFFGMESSLIFNSGYDANLGLLSSVPQKGDTVIYDEYVHASIRDGIKLGNAQSFSFEHNNLESLSKKIDLAKGSIYVVVETIYSMDGDFAHLEKIAEICEKHGAYLIVDEAHSGGLYDTEGAGLCSEQDINDLIFAKVVTFGKAYGSHGAVVLGSVELRDYLINFARSFIYTTALSPHAQERIAQVVSKAAGLNDERLQLSKNIEFFKNEMRNSQFELIQSESAIQSLMVPGNLQSKELANKIWNAGYAVKAILHPTIPEGKERLRICLHSFNSTQEISELLKIING